MTTPRIRLLSEEVKNQIAAGEVVERPASVVKELVENALDAGAQSLRVDLEQGGIALVRVLDDGCGMGPEDLALAFAPHATSKLATLADLEHIASLGFRGEALASIGSVARVRIFSRPRAAGAAPVEGAAVECEGGRSAPPHPAGGPEGTCVEVRDLFFNVPARRRFLKSPGAELARCLDVLQRLAIGSPGLALAVTHDGRRVFDVEAGLDLAGRVRRLFGSELGESLSTLAVREGSLALRGAIAPPRFARPDAGRQMWFVNGRAVRDKLLVRVLREATRGLIEGGRHPVAFLDLELAPELVDVNVHPAKAEVRFREERRVFAFLLGALRQAFLASDLAMPGGAIAPRAAPGTPWTAATAAGTRYGADRAAEPALAFEVQGRPFVPAPLVSTAASRPAAAPQAPEARTPGASRAPIEAHGPLLQVARCFIVRALADGFEVIDQHALHERVNYEAQKAELARGPVEIQRLLVPELVELSRSEIESLEPELAALHGIGLVFERFGPTTLALHGLPPRFSRARAADLARDVLDCLAASGRAPRREELLEAVLQRAACRASVMAGDELSQEQMQALLQAGAALESDQTCVHGRPTRVRFAAADLERAFLRR